MKLFSFFTRKPSAEMHIEALLQKKEPLPTAAFQKRARKNMLQAFHEKQAGQEQVGEARNNILIRLLRREYALPSLYVYKKIKARFFQKFNKGQGGLDVAKTHTTLSLFRQDVPRASASFKAHLRSQVLQQYVGKSRYFEQGMGKEQAPWINIFRWLLVPAMAALFLFITWPDTPSLPEEHDSLAFSEGNMEMVLPPVNEFLWDVSEEEVLLTAMLQDFEKSVMEWQEMEWYLQDLPALDT